VISALDLSGALAGLAAGDFPAAALWQALNARIDRYDAQLGCYLHRAEPSSRWAPAADAAALGGLPFALKDNMNLAGTPTTCASRLLAGYVSPYDCSAAARLETAGGRYLGKTNMDEFAMGSSGEHSAHRPTRNPWDLARSPGGSSSGSAAAVAADLALVALGSDTGGSIRLPAAFCGIVGVKPSYGRVSRYGLVAFASSLDQIGPLTKSVADAALVLELIMGHDPKDATTLRAPVPALRPELGRSLRGLRLGLPREVERLALDPAVRAAWDEAAQALAAEGARAVAVDLPHLERAVAAYAILANAEAASNLARFDGLRYGRRAEGGTLAATLTRSRSEGFGPEVKRRILLGNFALASGYFEAYYLRAQALRRRLAADFTAAFAACDAILLPTVATPAFRLGEKLGDPLAMYLTDLLTLPASLAGLPAASVPTALAGGLPIGMQLIARPLDEATLIRAAAGLERCFPFGERRRRAVAAALGETAVGSGEGLA
jgi:aspartyl-tRNA(Asn)/glutamyl-tRNA(Gln) amidotransferase subunit A